MGAFLYFSGVAFLSVGDPELSLDVSGMQKALCRYWQESWSVTGVRKVMLSTSGHSFPRMLRIHDPCIHSHQQYKGRDTLGQASAQVSSLLEELLSGWKPT